MKRPISKNNNRSRMGLWFGLILGVGMAAVLSWSLTVTKAQLRSGEQQQSSQLKVLVRTDAGDVVTSSKHQPSDEIISNLRLFLTRYPGTWLVDIDKGAVKNLKPTTPLAVTSSAKDFSIGLLSEFSNVFGLTSEETTYVVEFNLRNRRIVEFRQNIRGVPVEHSFITFSVTESQLEQVTSRVYPDVSRNLPTASPTVDKQEAIEVALADFRKNLKSRDNAPANYKAELVVLPDNNSYFLTWKIAVDATGSLDSFTYYVDAGTGRVILKYSNLLSQQNKEPTRQPIGLRSTEVASALLRESHPAKDVSNLERELRDKNGQKITASNSASHATPPDAVLQTILSENFDTLAFPYGLWTVFDNNGSTGGNLNWDDQNCVSHSPSWSLWAAAGGTNLLNACTDNYVDNMASWVRYGPFDLSGSTDGLLEFHYNNVSELNFDYFMWLVSVDGTNFHGYQTSGDSNGWQYQSLDFKNVPTLGNVTGRSQVWIAFVFSSDSSVVSGKGAFVDDVAIKKMVSSGCTGVNGHVGGHIYGRNKAETILSNFKSLKVVLNNSFALDSHTVTNSIGDYSSSECSDYLRFELEGYPDRNFVKVIDSNDTASLNGDTLTSGDLPFSSRVDHTFLTDAAHEDDKKELTVFWHVNDVHDWFAGLIGQDLLNYQMKAYVDYDDPKCPNAFYRPSDQNIFFCPSTDFARQSDVIYHEYTHGVIDHIPNYDLSLPGQPLAMNEGLADYFAASRNNDPYMDGGGRNLTTTVRYDDKCSTSVCDESVCGASQYWTGTANDGGCAHHNSLVVSGALWDLRQNRGLTTAYVDTLIIDTLILQKPIHYDELLTGLITQDGGAHEPQIRAAFATRGVTTGNCSYSLSPTSQTFIASASTGSFGVITAANCSWTATSNVSWLSTNSSGTGNGTVNYSVATNTGNIRTGTISVGGENFTVFQSAGNGSGCPSTTITLGQTINATLDTSCVLTGTSRYVDLYDFTGTAGQQIVIAMSSTAFDTFLFLNGPNNATIAQNDDGGGGLNSRIPADSGSFTLPTSGAYRIFATSYSVDGTTGSTGSYTISLLNGDSGSSSVQFSSSSYTVNEGAGSAIINLTRSGNLAIPSTVNYITTDIAGLQSCTLANGRASERCDYVTSLGTVRFSAGESSKTFSIPIIDDVLVEGNETFTLTLSNATGASLGSASTATVTIIDNDASQPTSNPIDGVEFFIRQQYLDILNRQPDGTGLQNWINTLAPCPNGGFGEPPTSNCDRLHVAAGFFQSDEFLNRGYFVFRFYMVAFNQRPTYAQFIPDMAQVGGPKSPAEEEASKVAFADAFVQRPEFLARYGAQSGQTLANSLLQTAGLPSGSYNAGSQTSGQILRGIAETSAALNKFLTEGTVSIMYFGFQRRDPDTIGYQNNVNTLNANPNNLRHMIFIFIYSTEYRTRFGPQ